MFFDPEGHMTMRNFFWRHYEMRENKLAHSTATKSIVTIWQCQPNIFQEKNIFEAKVNLMN